MKIIPISAFTNSEQQKERYARILLRKIIREENRRKLIQFPITGNNSQLLDVTI